MALWLGGCIALGAVTASCVLLDQEESTAGFFLLVAVVLLSLLDSFISSVIFSVVGAALLNCFFTNPSIASALATPRIYFPWLPFSSHHSPSPPLSGGLAALRRRSAPRHNCSS